MPTAQQFVDVLLTQDGDRYIFGHEVSASNSDPTAFDCSELVEWGCNRLKVVPRMPDGSWYQARHCRDNGTLIPVGRAMTTPGALLFSFGGGDPFTGGRPSSAHVAVAQGNGKTIEARSTRYGVGQFSVFNRGWTHAGLIPGITYTDEEDEMVSRSTKADDGNNALAPAFDEVVGWGVMSPHTQPGGVAFNDEIATFLKRYDTRVKKLIAGAAGGGVTAGAVIAEIINRLS